jgi:hypothetical protein
MKWYLVEGQKEFSEWNRAAIAKATGAQALQAVEPDPAVAQTINGKTLLPLTDDGPTKGPYQVATRTITHNGSTATAGYVVSNMALADRKTTMKTDITARRYEVETGGTTVSGTAIQTDYASQAKLSGALQLVQADDTVIVDWKGAAGWVQLNAAAVTAIATAVGIHVQAAFSREKALHDAVDDAANHAALDLIDIEDGSIDDVGSW